MEPTAGWNQRRRRGRSLRGGHYFFEQLSDYRDQRLSDTPKRQHRHTHVFVTELLV